MTRVHALAPILGLDLDGDLGDYHMHFQWFLNNIYYPNREKPIVARWIGASGNFDWALGLEKPEYRNAKLAYRMGGLKRCLPLFKNDYEKDGPSAVRSEIQFIRSMGIQVWICTTRPWLSLTTVDPDTKFWLDENVGDVDGLIYGEDKWLDLQEIAAARGQKILGVVDDLPENIIRAQQLGLRAAMRIGSHNRWWSDRPTDIHYVQFNAIRELSTIVEVWHNV